MDYLTSNLQTLSNSLFSDVFALYVFYFVFKDHIQWLMHLLLLNRVLFEIYRVCIEAMRDTVVDKFDVIVFGVCLCGHVVASSCCVAYSSCLRSSLEGH